MTLNENEIVIPDDQIMRGLKAKLVYESCDLICTPSDRCACDLVLEDIRAANKWINSLPGQETDCNDE